MITRPSLLPALAYQVFWFVLSFVVGFGIVAPVLAGFGLFDTSNLAANPAPLSSDAFRQPWVVAVGIVYAFATAALYGKPSLTSGPMYTVFSRVVNPFGHLNYSWFVRKWKESRRLGDSAPTGAELLLSYQRQGEALYGIPVPLGGIEQFYALCLALLGLTISLLLPFELAYLVQESSDSIGSLVFFGLISCSFLYYYAIFFLFVLPLTARYSTNPPRALARVFFGLTLIYIVPGSILSLLQFD